MPAIGKTKSNATSDTDTEVLVQFIGYLYKKEKLSFFETVKLALKEVVGAYGILVVCDDEPDKIIAARHGSPLIVGIGENENYINDYPKDLYIYNHLTKSSSPLISYEWFPSQAKYLLQEYDFPVFPDDFAYYLLKDDKTLVLISAVKSLNANFKYDIASEKLELYPTTGKFDFIISSFSKDCGHYKFDDNYKCNIYKPLISSNLIN